MTRQFATFSDLVKAPWSLEIEPKTAPRLLHFASNLVARATKTAIYRVDADGMPTDLRIVDALRDATCSQVTTWVGIGIDPAKGAADGGNAIASKSRGAASIQYAVYASTVLARASAATTLSMDARIILAEAGLNGSPIVTG